MVLVATKEPASTQPPVFDPTAENVPEKEVLPANFPLKLKEAPPCGLFSLKPPEIVELDIDAKTLPCGEPIGCPTQLEK